MRGVDRPSPPARPLDPGAVEVWWSPIDLAPDALAAARAALDAPARERVAALLRPDDRRRSTVAHALLRLRAAELLGVAPDHVVVRRRCASCGATDHGRPELAPVDDAPPPPAVSLSHAGGLAVVAFRRGGAVGVDLEPDRDDLDWERVRGHVFSDEEWAQTALAARPHAARLAAWTRKEAAAKATGHGVALGLERVRVDARTEGDGWHEVTLPDGLGPMRVRDITVSEGYAAAIAADGSSRPEVSVRRANF